MLIIKKIEKNKSNLNIEWSDGEKSNFNYFWLRDNCPTAHDKDSAHPAETKFLSQYSIPTATVNRMLAFYEDESDGDMELTAKEYLKNESAWTKWVPADVAKKVKAAL